MRRLANSIILAAALAAVLAGPALAGKPDHSPEATTPTEFPAGDVCDFAVRFENTVERAKVTVFDPAPNGSERTLIRGYYEAVATNLEDGTTYREKGGAVLTIVVDADGSVRVDVRGTSFIAWYYEGDESNLEPGLYDVNGHATEWYAPDGTFIRAVVRGHVTNLCNELAA